MKNVLQEYIELSDDKKKELWNSATFVFDTNILLNLYRYKASTRDTLLEALNAMKERIWLPFNVVEEYLKNRCEVIIDAENKYNEIIKESEKFCECCRTFFNLDSSDENLKDLQSTISKWIKNEKKENLDGISISKDKILNELLELFDNKIGDSFSEKESSEIKTEGVCRFENNIPPGYKDSKKTAENNSFGDLMIWKQILAYAKENKTNIILVSNDNKEDWWNKKRGRTIGPRYELRKEFSENFNGVFHMYSMNSFLEQYNKQVDPKFITAKILSEIKQADKDYSVIASKNRSGEYSIYYKKRPGLDPTIERDFDLITTHHAKDNKIEGSYALTRSKLHELNKNLEEELKAAYCSLENAENMYEDLLTSKEDPTFLDNEFEHLEQSIFSYEKTISKIRSMISHNNHLLENKFF